VDAKVTALQIGLPDYMRTLLVLIKITTALLPIHKTSSTAGPWLYSSSL